MKRIHRWLLLGGLLTATLAAAAWMHTQTGEMETDIAVGKHADARATATAPPAQSAPPRQVQLGKLDAPRLGEPRRDPFAGEAQARSAGKAPARPRGPPPIPFTYMGMQIAGGEQAAFLAFADHNLMVREGETIYSTYRIDRVSGDAITVTYLPLALTQTVLLGGPQ